MEKTLVIFKPDAIQRGIVGEILTRFERVGLKIVATKMVEPSMDHLYHHYENIGQMITRRGKQAFDWTVDYVHDGPVIAMVLEGIEAVSLVRKMVGTTESKSAAPGTIRGDYSHIGFTYADKNKVAITNLLHASGDVKEAKLEIEHWFTKHEIHKYQVLHEKFTQPKKK